MPPKKTPTSSLPATALFVNRVRYRGRATIQRILSRRTSPEIPSTRPSIIAQLPQEVLQIVIEHLADDKRSLRACCMTCYSWYIAAVPLLHQTLFVHAGDLRARKSRWPNPIVDMHRLGLLPLVKDLQIYGNAFDHISPKHFRRSVMSSFVALTCVRELQIWHLDIPSFMPTIRRYFDHFLPTVRSLTLMSPKGSRRQIVFFIGLFQHLEDLSLYNISLRSGDVEPADDPTLIPPSSPPLGGWLVVWNVQIRDLIKTMVHLFGGIRFGRVAIFDAAETQFLLKACAKTLWRLELFPHDPRANSSLCSFNLSQNTSLRDIQVTAGFVDDALRTSSMDAASEVFKYALSTTNPSTPCTVVLLYQEPCFRGIKTEIHSVWPHLRELSRDERTEEAAMHHRRFEFLRELRKVRDFRVVLCASVSGPVVEYAVRELKEAGAVERAKKEFDGLFVARYPRNTPW